MKYTNNFNLPQSLCNAVERDIYVPGNSDASVTEICKPIQQSVLERLHADDIVVDVSDQIFALMGKAIHHVLEVSDTELTEERLYHTTESGLTLGGKFDRFVIKGGVLQDYKVTSVWTKIFDSWKDWQDQLNCYALLLSEAGHKVDKIQVVMIYRDWSATMSERNANYPDQQVEVLDLPLWAEQETREFIATRLQQFVMCLDGQDTPPDCTSTEMWEQPTKYALMKEGRKTAIKVCDNYAEVIDFMRDKYPLGIKDTGDLVDPYYVDTRPGKRTRCEKYCNASPWCSQYQDYQLQQQGES